MSFADIESMVNAGCNTLLQNATLSYVNGVTPTDVLCIFADRRNAPDAISAPRAVREITAEVLEADLGGIVPGTSVTIRSAVYEVAKVERDKTGWVTLHLRGGVA